jgi:hypothetical protein
LRRNLRSPATTNASSPSERFIRWLYAAFGAQSGLCCGPHFIMTCRPVGSAGGPAGCAGEGCLHCGAQPAPATASQHRARRPTAI